MRWAYEKESSDSQSPARNSRGGRKVNSLCLTSLSVFVLTVMHSKNFSCVRRLKPVVMTLLREKKGHCQGSPPRRAAKDAAHLTDMWGMKPLTHPTSPAALQLSLCMSRDGRTLITLNGELHVQACGRLSRQSFLGGESAAGGPLIIFNTAVPERLKTKSQLRKELWGWSKAPRAAMQDERTLDSDCICDLSPLNLHPVSLCFSWANTSPSSSLFHPLSFQSYFSSVLYHLLLFNFLSLTVLL